MGEIVNLRQARKRKRRTERERDAAANRALHGRSAEDVLSQRLSKIRDHAHLEAHRRERPEKDVPQE